MDFDDPFGDGGGWPMEEEPFDDFDDDIMPPMDLDDPDGLGPARKDVPDKPMPEPEEGVPDPEVAAREEEEKKKKEEEKEEPKKKANLAKERLAKMRSYIHPELEVCSKTEYNVCGLGLSLIDQRFSLQKYKSHDELFEAYPTIDLADENVEAKPFLTEPVDTLMEQYEEQEKYRAQRKMKAIRVSKMRKKRGKRKDNLELWNDKYRPQTFQQLVSDDSINREVLDWIRRFARLVKGEDPYPDIDEGEEKPDVPRLCLLGGGAGIGKTTLARILGATLKYQINELNASDCRTATDLQNRIELVSGSETFVGAGKDASKGQLLILDEIDGVSTAGGAEGNKAIGAIVKMIQHDIKKKSKPNEWVIRAPIIAICNDMKAKSLKELSYLAKVIAVSKPNVARLRIRLRQICDTEDVIVRDDVLRLLCEESQCDIRCCLNTLQLLSTNRLEITIKDLKQHIARGGLKEYQADNMDILNLVFQVRSQRKDWHKNPRKLMDVLASESADFNIGTLAQLLMINMFQLSFPERILAMKHVANRLAEGDYVDRASFRLNAWELKPYALLVSMLTACDLFATDTWHRKTRIQKWDQRSWDMKDVRRQQEMVRKELLKFKMEEGAVKKGGEIQMDPFPARNKLLIFKHLGSSSLFGYREACFLTYCLNPMFKRDWTRQRQGKMSSLDTVDASIKSLESAIQLCVDFGLKMKEEGAGPMPEVTVLADFFKGYGIRMTSKEQHDIFEREIFQEVHRRLELKEAGAQQTAMKNRQDTDQAAKEFDIETKENQPGENEMIAEPKEELTGTLHDFFKVTRKKVTLKRDAPDVASQDPVAKVPKMIRNFNYSFLDGHTNAVFRIQKVKRFILPDLLPDKA